MKVVRQVAYRASAMQLLCASLLIHNLVGAAPQGLVNGANFTPDSQKIFNFPGQTHHSGVVPAIRLNGPNFISAPQPVTSFSQPQEPKISISQPFENTIPISQSNEPTKSISQPFENTLPITQSHETTISISQPFETSQPISQPQPTISIAQPQFTNRNSLPSNSPVSQNSFFINQQLPPNNFFNSQPVSSGQQPDFILRSQPQRIPFQQQHFVNPEPFLIPAIQESVSVIRDTDPVLIPHESVSVDSPINTVGSDNTINNFGGTIVSTGGESPLVSLFPEEEVVELDIPFLRTSGSISVGPVTGIQNQDRNSVQPQTTVVESSAKNLNTINSVDAQVDNFARRGPNTVDGNIVNSEGSNNNGISLSSVLNTIQGNDKTGVPISSTANSGNGNNNLDTSKAIESNTVSGDNNIGVPLTSIVSIASEDNTLSSSQNPTNNNDVNLMALLSSALNGDTNVGSSFISATDANTGNDFGSQTLGEVLLSLNGQNGIVVLPMDSLNEATIASDLVGTNDNQNITFRADEGSADADLGELLDAFVSDYVDQDEFEQLPPAAPPPPDLFRATLSDTLFVKGQWLGTLLGGLIDLGSAVTSKLSEFKTKS